MKREERRQAIMDLLIAARAVDLDDLAGRFAVSKMTIHRDLDDLEQTGLLRKVRGGATVEAGIQFESDFRIRALQDAGAKARMAAAALHLVEPGMSVMVNDGSMAALLGTRLVERAPLTIITNNAAVIETLKDAPRITLIALGGAFDAKFNGFFGVVTEQALSRLRADLAYLSTRDELTWVDVTAPGDGCAFALCDPVAVSGVAPEGKRWPLVISAAFTQTLSPERWRALRWRFFRLHFQYLCAFDRPGDYDYFRITAGPLTLAERFAGRAPSQSAIRVAASKFTSMAS